MASISTRMSTHWCDTAWFTPIGRPNCSRFVAWSTASASAPSGEAHRVRGVDHGLVRERALDAERVADHVVATDRDVGQGHRRERFRCERVVAAALDTRGVGRRPRASGGSRSTLTTNTSATQPNGTATFVPDTVHPSSVARDLHASAPRGSVTAAPRPLRRRPRAPASRARIGVGAGPQQRRASPRTTTAAAGWPRPGRAPRPAPRARARRSRRRRTSSGSAMPGQPSSTRLLPEVGREALGQVLGLAGRLGGVRALEQLAGRFREQQLVVVEGEVHFTRSAGGRARAGR